MLLAGEPFVVQHLFQLDGLRGQLNLVGVTRGPKWVLVLPEPDCWLVLARWPKSEFGSAGFAERNFGWLFGCCVVQMLLQVVPEVVDFAAQPACGAEGLWFADDDWVPGWSQLSNTEIPDWD